MTAALWLAACLLAAGSVLRREVRRIEDAERRRDVLRVRMNAVDKGRFGGAS